MASYALLAALSGFHYRADEASLTIVPRIFTDNFRCFFCVGSGWGSIGQVQKQGHVELSVAVEYGSVTLERVVTGIDGVQGVRATLAGTSLECLWDAASSAVRLETAARVEAGERLVLELQTESWPLKELACDRDADE